MGKGIGDAADPLLVSVRSGAEFSMPGMMDTVLNLGLNDESVDGLAKQTGDQRFAFDSYRRFIAMYARIVLDLPGEEFDSLFDAAKELAGTKSDAKVPTESAAVSRRLATSRSSSAIRASPSLRSRRSSCAAPSRRCSAAGTAPRHCLPRARAHPARPRHGRQRAGDGLRQPRRHLGHRRRLHPRPRHRRQGRLRRLPGQRPGRRRRRRHPQHRAALGAEEAFPAVHDELLEDLRPPRGALPRHVRHGVHHRAGQALDAPDPRRQAHRRGGAEAWPSTWSTTERPRDLAGPRRSRGSPRTISTRSCIPSSPARATASGPRVSGPARVPRWDASTSPPTTPPRRAGRGEPVILVRNETSPEDVHGMLASEGILTARAAWSATPPSWPAAGESRRSWVPRSCAWATTWSRVGDVTLDEGDWLSLDGGAGDRRGRPGAA